MFSKKLVWVLVAIMVLALLGACQQAQQPTEQPVPEA